MSPRFIASSLTRPIVCGFVLMAFVGCGSVSPIDSAGSGGITWSHTAEHAFAGIHSGSIDYLSFDKKIRVVIWTDTSSGSRVSTNQHGATGVLTSVNGQEFQWNTDTKDGRTGRIQFDEQEFDLADGGFFLLSTAGDSLTVAQLKRGPIVNDLDAAETIRELAENDDTIQEFFQSAASESPSEN